MTQQILPTRKRLNKKNLFQTDTTVHDYYRFYTKKYGTATKGGTYKKTFRAVINEFNKWMAEKLVKGEKFVPPFRLGTLEVVSMKQRYEVIDGKINTKRLLPDWPSTFEYWKKNEKAVKEKKLLHYTNEHSDNMRYKFFWSKKGVKSREVSYYSFNPSRLLSRKLANYILDSETLKNYAQKC